jgi:hypothetical protein
VATGQPDVTYYFTATANPPGGTNSGTVALPITFTWQATNQLSQTHLNAASASDVVSFTWSITGAKTITVTALNVGGAVSKTHMVEIKVDITPSFVYLPLVLRH